MAHAIYRPLNEQADEIRILLLHPQKGANDEINCTLQYISLDSIRAEILRQVTSEEEGYTVADESSDGELTELLEGCMKSDESEVDSDLIGEDESDTESDADQDSSYEAVSYTWGAPGGNYTILVNSREMAVRYNLWQLLSDLQTQANENQKDRRLWIDAICIDQNAEVEKSRQIPRMGIIYRRARRVLVWLGPEAREAQWAMDFVDSSWARAGMMWPRDDFKGDDSIMDHDFDDGRSTIQGSVKDMLEADMIKCLKQAKEEGDMENAEIKAGLHHRQKNLRYLIAFFRSVMSSAWWARLWVVQEAAAASKVVVSFGSRQTSLSKLLRVIFTAIGSTNSVFIEPFYKYAVNQTRHFEFLRRSRMQQYRMTDLVTRFRGFQSTLPEDKIFALVGLCPEYAKMETSKDADSRYTRPATDTFKQYARLIMEKEGNLHYMFHAGENDRGNDLPSWVPDLRSSKYAASLLLKNGVRRSQIARCSSARGNRRFEFSEDSNELTVTGVFVDKITKLSKDSLEDSSGGTLDHSYIQECIETDESRAGEWPAGSRIENFIRTMLANSVELEQSLDNDNDLAEAIINISRDIGDPMLLLQFLGDIKGPGSDASPLHGLIARQDPRFNAQILSDLGGVENPYVLQIKETVKSTLTMVHKHRRFAAMDSGFAGLVPSASKEGDAVCLFADCHLPVIIRQERVGEKYKFIGAAYIYGVNAKVFSDMEQIKVELDQIRII